MIDLFRILKQEYQDYLILFKCGSFYLSFNEDATILNNIFNYKINEMKNNIKIGFPIKLINDNIEIIKQKEISYLVIEDKRITDKHNSDNNKYQDYVSSVFNIISFNNRLENIINKIKLINDENLKEKIVLKIEKILQQNMKG